MGTGVLCPMAVTLTTQISGWNQPFPRQDIRKALNSLEDNLVLPILFNLNKNDDEMRQVGWIFFGPNQMCQNATRKANPYLYNAF